MSVRDRGNIRRQALHRLKHQQITEPELQMSFPEMSSSSSSGAGTCNTDKSLQPAPHIPINNRDFSSS